MGKRLVDNNTIRKNQSTRRDIRAAFAALVSGEYFESADRSILVRDRSLNVNNVQIAWVRVHVEVTQYPPADELAQHMLRYILDNK